MWILNVAGHDHWLKPGKAYTFGRDNADFDLRKERSVSRRHLVIEVSDVVPNSVAHPSVRTRVMITDLGSRHGSLLNGNRIKSNVPVRVEGAAATMRIGPRATVRLKWSPLTLTNPVENNFEELSSMLAPLDVKVVPNVVRDTSHYLQRPSSHHSTGLLFALVKGIPVVSDEYPMALLESSLNWESNFKLPDPTRYCPKAEWQCNPLRGNCLSGQVFKGSQDLEPIVEAAGGSYNPSDSSAYTLKDDQLLLDAIVRCRPYDPGLQHEDQPRPSKRQKLDLLGFMTRQEGSGKIYPEPQSSPGEKESPKRKANAQASGVQKPKRQRTRGKKTLNESNSLPKIEREPSPQPEPLDLEALRNVTIVEDCIELRSPPGQSATVPVKKSTQNFKAFRRKQQLHREHAGLSESGVDCPVERVAIVESESYPVASAPSMSSGGPDTADDEFAFSFTT